MEMVTEISMCSAVLAVGRYDKGIKTEYNIVFYLFSYSISSLYTPSPSSDSSGCS